MEAIDYWSEEEIRAWILDPESDGWGYDERALGNEERVFQAMRSIFQTWRESVGHLSPSKQDKVVWKVIGFPVFIGMFVLNSDKYPLADRVAMTKDMKNVTLAVPYLHPENDPMENGYFMWWDTVAQELVQPELADACLDVLADLAKHKDVRVRMAAIHGLGHLDHPYRETVMTGVMAREKVLDAEWLKRCRNGTVM